MFELTWNQFRNLQHIRMLNESQQRMMYSLYLDELVTQVKGKSPFDITTPDTGYLLQENGDYLLQEDGNKIKL